MVKAGQLAGSAGAKPVPGFGAGIQSHRTQNPAAPKTEAAGHVLLLSGRFGRTVPAESEVFSRSVRR